MDLKIFEIALYETDKHDFLRERHWKLWAFSVLSLWNKVSEKRKPLSKNWGTKF